MSGKHSPIKCRPEASSPRLSDFLKALNAYIGRSSYIQVVTDDHHIFKEISETDAKGHVFLKPDPAPNRIPDKVSCIDTYL